MKTYYTDYKVITGVNEPDIEANIKNALLEGYTFIGGLSSYSEGGYVYYTQAIAKLITEE